MLISYNILNYNKFFKENFFKKKSNKNIILLPDYNTFLINNSIKNKKNHHLSKVLNDDLVSDKIIKDSMNDILDDILNNVYEKINNNIIVDEVKNTIDDLVNNIVDNNDFIIYMNSISEDDFGTCNKTGIPLKSFLNVGYHLFHN